VTEDEKSCGGMVTAKLTRGKLARAGRIVAKREERLESMEKRQGWWYQRPVFHLIARILSLSMQDHASKKQ